MKKTLYFAFFLTVTAALVTGIAYLGYNWTEPIIAANRAKKIEENISLLYSSEDGFEKNPVQGDNDYNEKSRKYTDNGSGNISGIYEVLNSNDVLEALIYNVDAQGRNGLVYALIAVDPYTDQVVGVTYYLHGETPNIGEKHTRDEAIETLLGQVIGNVVVDEIAGASVTWGAINEMFSIINTHYSDEEVHING
jgi:Na+-transporting NADH:ubiquinone oxidoreductase subunit C